MSTNYVQEPSTSGKVIFYTSHGELDIQLWTRQCPLACRNFIQLSLQGYYDNTMFHRIIPGFMIQGGDPTGTGQGGQSIYQTPFKDQFHQRLKFTHRGLVAMANLGRNTNTSQFFITFGQCTHLNKKHTIFGKVVGNTMFNLMAMQSIDTDSADRPLQPPYIKKVKVMVNPFEDIRPRGQVSKEDEAVRVEQQKRDKKAQEEREKQELRENNRKLKKRNLLSFQEEVVGEQGEKMVSAHDGLEDGRLSKRIVITQEEQEAKMKAKEQEERKKEELKAHMAAAAALADQSNQNQTHLAAKQMTERIRQEISKHKETEGKIQDEVNQYNVRVNPKTGKKQLYWGEEEEDQSEEEEGGEMDQERLREIRQSQKKEYDAIRTDALKFKEVQEGSLNRQEKINLALEKTLLSNVQRRRLQFIQKRDLQRHQGTMLQRLSSFKKRIQQSKTGSNPQGDDSSWSTHRLKFHIDSDNAYKYISKVQNARDFEDSGLVVIAPPEKDPKKQGMDLQQLERLAKSYK